MTSLEELLKFTEQADLKDLTDRLIKIFVERQNLWDQREYYENFEEETQIKITSAEEKLEVKKFKKKLEMINSEMNHLDSALMILLKATRKQVVDVIGKRKSDVFSGRWIEEHDPNKTYNPVVPPPQKRKLRLTSYLVWELDELLDDHKDVIFRDKIKTVRALFRAFAGRRPNNSESKYMTIRLNDLWRSYLKRTD